MNIFALHPDPVICASYHCDQHLHKMILESAQMLSTMFHKQFPRELVIRANIYKITHENHPCTVWTTKCIHNAAWLIKLCKALQDIRYYLGKEEHASMQIIKSIDSIIESDRWNHPKPFVFAGPDQIRLRPDLNTHKKYQALYILKYKEWLDTKHQMSYKGRPLPEFLSEFSTSIIHGV